MDGLRKPLQGVCNILRFNWHFYLLAIAIAAIIAGASVWLEGLPRLVGVGLVVAIGGVTLVSLLVSCYVYDLSGLYRFDWLDTVASGPGVKMVNIHAGFDETSTVLRACYLEASRLFREASTKCQPGRRRTAM